MEQVTSKPKFKIGDKIRISMYKRSVFDKGHTPKWTEELFTIDNIQYTNPITYKIRILEVKIFKGVFMNPKY